MNTKIILSILTSTALLLSLTSCADETEDGTSPTSSSVETNKVTGPWGQPAEADLYVTLGAKIQSLADIVTLMANNLEKWATLGSVVTIQNDATFIEFIKQTDEWCLGARSFDYTQYSDEFGVLENLEDTILLAADELEYFSKNSPEWIISGDYTLLSASTEMLGTHLYNLIIIVSDVSLEAPQSGNTGSGALSQEEISAAAADNFIIELVDNEIVLRSYTGAAPEIQIPDVVTYIDSKAFYGNITLKSVKFPDSVAYIGYEAFHGCISLSAVEFGNSLVAIEERAFYECASLDSVDLPNSLTSIGRAAFGECTSLSTILIPDSVTYLGPATFSNCSSLVSATLPNSITELDFNFNGCSSLQNVNFPTSLIKIHSYTFADCISLETIVLPDSVVEIGNHAFTTCSSLSSVDFGESLTLIDASAFRDCTKLQSISLPDSLLVIEGGAFSGCNSLSEANFGASLISIGDYAFQTCTPLKSATFPETLSSIGTGAFSVCPSFKTISVKEGSYSEKWGKDNGYTVNYY
ncbi:MAG: leucine-rich repeat domain-containing protein [Eubacteriales bacterium]